MLSFRCPGFLGLGIDVGFLAWASCACWEMAPFGKTTSLMALCGRPSRESISLGGLAIWMRSSLQRCSVEMTTEGELCGRDDEL